MYNKYLYHQHIVPVFIKYFSLTAFIIALMACRVNSLLQRLPAALDPDNAEQAKQITPAVQVEQPVSVSPLPSPTAEVTATRDTASNRAFEDGLPLAARVNNQPIFLDSYQKELMLFEQALQAQDPNLDGESPVQIDEQVLNGLIDRLIIEQQAEKLGLTVSPETVEAMAQESINQGQDRAQFEAWLADNNLSYEEFKETLQAQLIANQLFEQITHDVPTTAPQIHIRQILVADEAAGQAILEQLNQGADFTTLAQEQSLDETSRAKGGDLGWLPQQSGLLPPGMKELEATVSALEPGEISDLIPTSLGYHIIKLEDKVPERPLSSETLQMLKKQIFEEWLTEQRSSALIEKYINP